MAAGFDPYHRWLGIRSEDQPPNHYQLLGLAWFEDDFEVMVDAAERQMSHVRRYGLGNHGELSQKILTELAAAKACLLNPVSKSKYDEKLRAADTTQTELEPTSDLTAAGGQASAERPSPASNDESRAIRAELQAVTRRTGRLRLRLVGLLSSGCVVVVLLLLGVFFWTKPSSNVQKQIQPSELDRDIATRQSSRTEGKQMVSGVTDQKSGKSAADQGDRLLSPTTQEEVTRRGSNHSLLNSPSLRQVYETEPVRIELAQAVLSDVSYKLESGSPSGVAIDSESGTFTWTPTEAQGPGVYSFAVLARQTSSNVTDRCEFTVRVIEKNERPKFYPIANRTIDGGSTFQLKLHATDSDEPANKLSYTLVEGPPSARIVAGDHLAWNPSGPQRGSYRFVLRVTDDQVPALSSSVSFDITIGNNGSRMIASQGAPSSNKPVDTVEPTSVATYGESPLQNEAPLDKLFSKHGSFVGRLFQSSAPVSIHRCEMHVERKVGNGKYEGRLEFQTQTFGNGQVVRTAYVYNVQISSGARGKDKDIVIHAKGVRANPLGGRLYSNEFTQSAKIKENGFYSKSIEMVAQ